GIYSVSLTVYDNKGSSTETKINYITVTVPLVADFTADITSGEAPLTVQFTDLSTGYPTSWEWDFDNDGTVDSYLQHPDFSYAFAGTYSVSLKVTNNFQEDIKIRTDYIIVTEPFVCPSPTNLAVGNITYNSAELDWTPGNSGSQWDLLWGFQGFDPLTEGELIEGIFAHPYMLDELVELTSYDFYVRTVCDDEVSEWAGPQTFTTLEYLCEPDWTLYSYFQYNMQIIGELYIEDVQSFNPNDKIGAFVNGECRGIAAPDPDLNGLVFLSVGSNMASGELVEFVIWKVNECAECSTGENITFENQLQVGTPGNPYLFQCALHELDLSFGQGYTWFSVNIDPGSMMLNDLFTSLSPCEEDRIIGQNAFAVVYNSAWVGSLTEISPAQMYKMQLCNQQDMTLEGLPVDNNPVTLGAGYTWLGYLPQGGLEINTALANLSPLPMEDNRLIGQNAFAVYYQGQWVGSLTQLQPGNGYIIELSNESVLTYPAATDGEGLEPENEILSPTGEQPLVNQQYNMMLIAQLELPDGTISLNSDDVIYAFSGEECRGMAIPHEEHNGVIFMSIGADEQAGEEITFKAWLSEFGTFEDINETISFEAMKKAGTVDQPVLLTLKGFTGIGGNIAEGILIGDPFPNPFNDQTEISYRLPFSANVRLLLFNSHGQMVAMITDEIRSAGLHTLAIKRDGLAPGVYYFRMYIMSDDLLVQKNGKLIISQ
ncbi:MAG: PKD domain-containing protein, partial [Sphingobacteriia bacterium]|nr:PKD domain-containing protein [Sphingobacteriia bacterium]